MIRFKYVIIMGIGLFFSSCNKKNDLENAKKERNTAKKTNLVLDYHENHFKKLRKEMNRIEISLYKIRGDVKQDTTKVVESYKIVDKTIIKEFNILFDTIRNQGYCCCPKSHYVINLFNQTKKLKTFNVDTLRVKNNAFIFDTSFQTSYIIPLKVWKNFIKDSKSIKS